LLLVAICGGGAIVVALAIAATIGVVVVVHRRRKKVAAFVAPIQMDLLGLSATVLKNERRFDLSETAEFGIVASEQELDYGLVDVDKPSERSFRIELAPERKEEIEISLLSLTHRDQNYRVEAEPSVVVIKRKAPATVRVRLTLLCTTRVYAPLALRRTDGAGYILVGLHAEGALSTKLDWGDIRLEKKVGEGSFGRVYRARYRGQVVAVKEVKLPLDSDFISDVMREVDLVTRLRSPYIVTFIGTAIGNERLHIVTEYMALGNLRAFLDDHPERFNPKLEVKCALDCARGMAFLSDNGIINRDLSALVPTHSRRIALSHTYTRLILRDRKPACCDVGARRR